MFWKYTGLITLTINPNQEIIPKRSKLVQIVLLLVMTVISVINVYFAFQHGMATSTEILYALYVSSITLGSLLNFATVHSYQNLISTSIQILTTIDNSVTQSRFCREVNRKSILIIFCIYLLVFTATATFESYFFTKFSFSGGRLCNFLLYYLFYIVNVSTSLFIFFFLMELGRRFRAITNWYCSRISDQVLLKQATSTFFQTHRSLRDVSKRMNTVFRGVMLGKILSSSSVALFTAFHYSTHWKEIVGAGEYAIVVSGMWSIGHILEIMGIVYYFSVIRHEVSFFKIIGFFKLIRS